VHGGGDDRVVDDARLAGEGELPDAPADLLLVAGQGGQIRLGFKASP
jgi:hypothetical protein